MARHGMLTAPESYKTLQAVTPSDETEYDPPFDALWVGGGGDVAVTDTAGNTVTLSGASAGQEIRVAARKVMSTNTDATLIVGMRF